MTRSCNECSLEKALEDFAKDKNRKDGRAYTCKACNSARACRWSKDNRERVQKNQLAWRTENRDLVNRRGRETRARRVEHYRAKARARRNTAAGKHAAHWKWIKRKYGLTQRQWMTLFISQGACCGCCGAPEPRTKNGWHTDHDHTTGAVRGIVCHLCNLMLGAARDAVANLEAGIAYLQRAHRC